MNKTAVAYFRTSSFTNVDGNSLPRQQEAVASYARLHDIEIVKEFYDPGVPGRDPVADRPGFGQLLDYVAGNGARIVLVENASRFARDLMVQLVGHDLLKNKGISLIPVDAPEYFTDETDTAIMVRQILGAVAEFEKRGLVGRLRKGRDFKKAQGGRHTGRKTIAELAPEAVGRAVALRGAGHTLRSISAVMAAEGLLTPRYGRPYSPGTLRLALRRAAAL